MATVVMPNSWAVRKTRMAISCECRGNHREAEGECAGREKDVSSLFARSVEALPLLHPPCSSLRAPAPCSGIVGPHHRPPSLPSKGKTAQRTPRLATRIFLRGCERPRRRRELMLGVMAPGDSGRDGLATTDGE